LLAVSKVGRRWTVLGAAALFVSGCVSTLPDQDRRIVQATAVAKLSTDDLWNDYQQSAAEADRKYWGKAVEVSGTVTAVVKDRTPPELHFGPTPDAHVRAALLEDQAAALLESAAPGQRIRLKCFCDGVKGAVILKSCVKP
jgi:hypothetical protein